MNEHADPRDEGLIQELRALGRVMDTVPPGVVFAAKASFSWRTIDAELAELTYDSVMDEDRLAVVRGHDAARLLTFSTPALTIDVQVNESGRERQLVGHLVPGQPAVVVIKHSTGETEATTDADGRFLIDGVPAGPLSLSCRLADGQDKATVQTEWVTL